MTQLEQNLEKAKVAWCEAMLILGYHINSVTTRLRNVALGEEELSCEEIKEFMKQFNIASKRVSERAATVEQFRLLKDISIGKLNLVASDGNEVKVIF